MMQILPTLLFAGSLWSTAYAAINAAGNYILEPVSISDLGHSRRDVSQIDLQNQTSLFWSHALGDGSIFMNVTVNTGENEMVLSTEHFRNVLKSVTCTDSLSLTFNSQDSYKKAISDWHWVNFNEQRTFIMIVNYGGCNAESGRQPWVVNWATYDDVNFVVNFKATQKEWKDLNVPLVVRFGERSNPTQPGTPQKRFDIKLPPIPTAIPVPVVPIVPLPVPTAIPLPPVPTTVNVPIPNANGDINSIMDLERVLNATFVKESQSGLDFSLNCKDCSTKGSLKIGGKIEANFAKQEFDVTITAQPVGVLVDLNLVADISGKLSSDWKKEIILGSKSLPSFEVPGIAAIGPELQFDAGVNLSGIQGKGSIGAGITAKIPDNSMASLNPTVAGSAKVEGWKPELYFKPLSADAQVNGKLSVFVSLSASVGVSLFNKGVGVGFALKIPDINMATSAIYSKSGGACPDHPEPFGVRFDSGIDVDIQMQGFTNTGRDKDITIRKELFKNKLAGFPQLCSPVKLGSTLDINQVLVEPSIASSVAQSTTLSVSTLPSRITSQAETTSTTSEIESTPTQSENEPVITETQSPDLKTLSSVSLEGPKTPTPLSTSKDSKTTSMSNTNIASTTEPKQTSNTSLPEPLETELPEPEETSSIEEAPEITPVATLHVPTALTTAKIKSKTSSALKTTLLKVTTGIKLSETILMKRIKRSPKTDSQKMSNTESAKSTKAKGSSSLMTTTGTLLATPTTQAKVLPSSTTSATITSFSKAQSSILTTSPVPEPTEIPPSETVPSASTALSSSKLIATIMSSSKSEPSIPTTPRIPEPTELPPTSTSTEEESPDTTSTATTSEVVESSTTSVLQTLTTSSPIESTTESQATQTTTLSSIATETRELTQIMTIQTQTSLKPQQVTSTLITVVSASTLSTTLSTGTLAPIPTATPAPILPVLLPNSRITSLPPNALTQPGINQACKSYITAIPGDTCNSIIESTSGKTDLSTFQKLNPAVSVDCKSGLLSGYVYCVGLAEEGEKSRRWGGRGRLGRFV